VSRKRKKPGQQRGGRYTPPAGGSARRTVAPVLASADGLDGDGDDGDDGDDARWPVTISLPSGGNRTVPQAFAEWVQSDGRLDEFDALMRTRHEQGLKGDPLTPFLRDRDDVPGEVAAAATDFDDYLDHLFGPPVT
jgi:hypothetical protein